MLLAAVIMTSYCFQPVSAAEHKIVVIADPHVMGNGLLTNLSSSDWATYLGGSRKLIDYSQALFDQAVTNISAMEEKPELVLIVGDLTKDGEEASHEYVAAKLKVLKEASIQTLVIPGNHDLGTSEAKVFGETTTAATTIDAEGFKTLYKDYGYGETSELFGSSMTYVSEPINDLVVIGIDSGTGGSLSDDMLTWVTDKASKANEAGKQVIVMMHHPLIPHITGGEAFVSSVSVANYEKVRNSLADAGVRVVFTGHFHTSDIVRDWNEDMKRTIYDVTTGSLCSYPCDYRVVTLNKDLTSMEINTESIAKAGKSLTGEDFSVETANTRLKDCMTTILMTKVKAKLMEKTGNELLASALANALVPKLVDAYIYHAEGDEHKNTAAQELLNDLTTQLGSYPAYLAMANSILEDKSNYGDAKRVDQTDDRKLSVSWPDSGKAGISDKRIVNSEKSAAAEWFSLDGRKLDGMSVNKGVYIRDGKKIVFLR